MSTSNKDLIRVEIYLKSGQVMVFDNFTQFSIKSRDDSITSIECEQDLRRGKQFFFCALDQIAAINVEPVVE